MVTALKSHDFRTISAQPPVGFALVVREPVQNLYDTCVQYKHIRSGLLPPTMPETP